MYANELPFDINKELCRLLDIDDYWKDLAGNWMGYQAFDVKYIQQTSCKETRSPTEFLFEKWGRDIHRVEELFILLYKMKHMPALKCLKPVVNTKYHSKIRKLSESSNKKWKTDVNDNSEEWRSKHPDVNQGLPRFGVMLVEKSLSRQGDKGNNTDGMREVLSIPMISYEELKKATDDWADCNLLGSGGFGHVYKGEWIHSPVAVKRLRDNSDQNKLIREMCLNQYRHDNILPLYGYSLGGPYACIVYQLMAGGSLQQRLRDKSPPLSWTQRYYIMHGVARGLQFLHTMRTPLIHGDIKPDNILLDACLMPRIGDFGQAREVSPDGDKMKEKVLKIYGARPYLPVDYLRHHIPSPAVDVFSYGVVMVKVATALAVDDKTRPQRLLAKYIHELFKQGLDMATLEDPVLRDTAHSDPAMCTAFIEIGVHCTQSVSDHRPTMLDVYQQLNDMEVPVNNTCDVVA